MSSRTVRDNNNSRSSPRINLNSNRYNNNYNNQQNYRENNYRNNDNYNISYNRIENDNNHPRTMSPVGKQLIYSNDIINNEVNKDIYKNPNTASKKII